MQFSRRTATLLGTVLGVLASGLSAPGENWATCAG